MKPSQLDTANQAFLRGETDHARKLVAQLLVADPRNEQAWLLLARLVNDRDKLIDCLVHASKINPTNAATISALQALKQWKPSPSGTTADHTESALAVASILATAQIRLADHPPGPQYSPQPSPEPARQAIRPARRHYNLPLFLGGFVVSVIILVAVLGPRLAPHDPLEEHAIMHVGDQWLRPPFDAFQVPGFPLGSDIFGRDMLSRILYAIRPTLIMVSIVAVVRLLLGIFIGLSAGWATGRLRYLLDGLISFALAIPILLVALGAITVVGAETGLVAFIVGLSINGWGETARFVQEQTQLIKGQPFIEAARSLGASTFRLLIQHIFRQISPMIWMLFSFEISGTLIVTAGLGFLGYYIGGDVWIEIADFISQRTSGAPELGQMLATSWNNILRSWPLIITGMVIFIMVLGFNLLGEGLRLRATSEYINRNSLISKISYRFSSWFETTISFPLSRWMRVNRLRPALVMLLVFALGVSFYLYLPQLANRFNPSRVALMVPGSQIWAAEKVDPFGTYFINFSGPANPRQLWMVNHPLGFSGSPALAADGTIYAAGLDQVLLAFNPDGTLRWQSSLPEIPSGPIAIGPNGSIYITCSDGGLSAFDPDGNQLWTFSADVAGEPKRGAIVDPGGIIYYLVENQVGDTLIALQPSGHLLWSIKPGTRRANTGLRLSPDGKHIYVQDVAVNTHDGSLVNLSLPTQEDIALRSQAHLLVGADGKTYLLAGHIVIQWEETSQGFKEIQRANWDFRHQGLSQDSGLPLDAAVIPNGEIVLFYSSSYVGTSIYWIGPTGRLLGEYLSPFSNSNQLVAIDGTGTAYICGLGFSMSLAQPVANCEADRPDASTPVWSYMVDEGSDTVAGAALAPGRMYITTHQGKLIALSDTANPPAAPSITP